MSLGSLYNGLYTGGSEKSFKHDTGMIKWCIRENQLSIWKINRKGDILGDRRFIKIGMHILSKERKQIWESKTVQTVTRLVIVRG